MERVCPHLTVHGPYMACSCPVSINREVIDRSIYMYGEFFDVYCTCFYTTGVCVYTCVSAQDLCDIEEELETKLGVFHVKILGLAGLGQSGNETEGEEEGGGGGGGGGGGRSSGLGGDSFEVQLKLCSQKWKARCRVTRGQQAWQDEDVSVSSYNTLYILLVVTVLCHIPADHIFRKSQR